MEVACVCVLAYICISATILAYLQCVIMYSRIAQCYGMIAATRGEGYRVAPCGPAPRLLPSVVTADSAESR